MKLTTFKNIPIGIEFIASDRVTKYIKHSTKTAKLKYNNAIFYYGQNERVYHEYITK